MALILGYFVHRAFGQIMPLARGTWLCHANVHERSPRRSPT